ncbi:MAG: SOS response-associated peptidase family protein [Enterobacterales bacterium]|nr:SOS response-associated peptidase family protein [Enterobacterales bacterium]
MCGRFNVIDDPLSKLVSDWLKIDFKPTESNSNVCPSQSVDCLIATSANNQSVTQIAQQAYPWGLRTDWSNKLLINARSETVAEKTTFRSGFSSKRCIIPISSWYEWKTDFSGNKTKYEFIPKDGALLMAGILVKQVNSYSNQGSFDLDQIAPDYYLVSLTTTANKQCQPIHSRMPLMINQDAAENWLYGDFEQAKRLLDGKMPVLDIKSY